MRPILLATDNANDVYSFWTHHRQCGIHNRVEVLSDGTDVVRYLASSPLRLPVPALLVASLHMPQMGALQLLEQLGASRRQDFPTIFLLQPREHSPELVASAHQLGVESFLFTPIQKKEFCQLMSQFQSVTMDDYADAKAKASSSALSILNSPFQ